MFKPLSKTLNLAQSQTSKSSESPPILVRFLKPTDIEAILALERIKWNDTQAAEASTLRSRIELFPNLSIGAFSTDSGEMLASLFLKPITMEHIRNARTWSECAAVSAPIKSRFLFGISLSSIDPRAVTEIFKFFWPYALKSGWRRVYLGSPIPGFAAWKTSNPRGSANEYVWQTLGTLPRDPQLRYYYKKGFRKIEGWRADYFPHELSLDHAAVISANIPLSSLWFFWRFVPLVLLQQMRRVLFSIR